MPAYLVRLIKNRDIVGIFTADDEIDLELAVDECTDVPGCEYVELPDGGIMWTSPAIAVPLEQLPQENPDDEDEEIEFPDFPWPAASFSERWFDVVYGFADVEWTPFVPDAPQEPEPEPEPKPMGPGQVVPRRRRR